MPIISIPGLVGKEGHTKCVLTPSLSLTDHPLSLEIIFMFFFLQIIIDKIMIFCGLSLIPVVPNILFFFYSKATKKKVSFGVFSVNVFIFVVFVFCLLQKTVDVNC